MLYSVSTIVAPFTLKNYKAQSIHLLYHLPFFLAGTCVCGECTCYDVDPSGDWGDIHGDTCECDERSCHATYDRYSDEFCSGKTSVGFCVNWICLYCLCKIHGIFKVGVYSVNDA